MGSHSTGKTTLCRYVSEKYKIPMISEVARAVLAQMETSLGALRADISLVNRYQAEIFKRQTEEEYKLEPSNNFVSDRSFDNLAYAAEHTTIFREVWHSKECQAYLDWVKQGVVFFVRPHQSLMTQDGVRELGTWEDIIHIDGMVKLLLELAGINYFSICSRSLQERIRFVDAILTKVDFK